MDRKLEQYFKDNDHVIDYALRVQRNSKGEIYFYIHPAHISGETVDYIVDGNELTNRFEWNEAAQGWVEKT
jgi:hypothetical protein